MSDTNWKFPNLSRDLAMVGAGIVAAAALVGAGVGVAVDVLVHRHRKP